MKRWMGLLGFVWVCHALFVRIYLVEAPVPASLAVWARAMEMHRGLYLISLGTAAAVVTAGTITRFDELPTRWRVIWVAAVGLGSAGWVFQCFVSYLETGFS